MSALRGRGKHVAFACSWTLLVSTHPYSCIPRVTATWPRHGYTEIRHLAPRPPLPRLSSRVENSRNHIMACESVVSEWPFTNQFRGPRCQKNSNRRDGSQCKPLPGFWKATQSVYSAGSLFIQQCLCSLPVMAE